MTQSLLSLDLEPTSLFQDFRVEPEEAKSILRPQKDARYGWGFSLNPYRGCSHGCRYCYVRGYPAPKAGAVEGRSPDDGKGALEGRLLHDPQDWGRWVTPKLNAPELLWGQRHKLHGESVFISSATDPYQPIERDFRLTRKCLQVLMACPTTQVIIHTRSPLVLQDLGLLQAFGSRLSVGFSIPTDDEAVRQIVEPDAPSIPSRWSAIERLAKAGIRVSIGATPLLPVRDIAFFARRVRESGAKSAWVGGLRLLKEDPFYSLLAEQRWLHILDPEYAEQVREAFRRVFHGSSKPLSPRSASQRGKEGKGCSQNRPRLIPEPVWARAPRLGAGLHFPQLSHPPQTSQPSQPSQPSLFEQAS